MALEAVVYPKGLFDHYDGNKDLYSLQQNWRSWDLINLPTGELEDSHGHLRYDQDSPSMEVLDQCNAAVSTRQKRRRVRTRKNKEEIENQRMTHIAVERNRRKQMNEYLSVLKSLMPDSYVQRSDQASIVGGAINYVKELEQNLHCLSAQTTRTNRPAFPFGEFFSFPQYSTMVNSAVGKDGQLVDTERGYGEMSSVADVEVSMVECHANLKIRSKKHPKQLLKLVSGLHCLRLSILHLNVTTVNQFALYCISVKVEDGCSLTSADEVATEVHQLIGRIQEEACLS